VLSGLSRKVIEAREFSLLTIPFSICNPPEASPRFVVPRKMEKATIEAVSLFTLRLTSTST